MYYLKYRPQKIEELDLRKVRERLRDVLERKEIPHAFLFSGPRGAGKTSAARIVAKAVNCETKHQNIKASKHQMNKTAKQQDGKTSKYQGEDHTSHITLHTFQIEPCNECGSCRAIMRGGHLDIIEIDAASNRGIDQIRDLRDKIGLSPGSAKYKVYIIDEVHMLTKEAFNALLKTLEEPPKHAVFILATTEPHRLPETVRSRCVEIEFAKANVEEIVRSLERVVKGEKLDVENNVLEYIAGMVDGSFRDATKILEEATGGIGGTGGTGKKVAVGDVERVVGSSRGEVGKFIELLGKKDVVELLEYINKRVEDGVDVSWLTKAVLDELHSEFLAGYGVQQHNRTNRTNKTYTFDKEELVRLMRLLEGAAREERDAVVAQMPLELAVIDWCNQ